jgi:hypothetical protein
MIREYEKTKTVIPKSSTVEDVKVRSNVVSTAVDPSKSSKDDMMAERSSRRIQSAVVNGNSLFMINMQNYARILYYLYEFCRCNIIRVMKFSRII